MSWKPSEDPECDERGGSSPFSRVIEPRARDVAGLPVGRILPVARQRMVGPFVFLDEMGPVTLAEGRGVDVPPHPHIGLATVTYLFEGSLVHRDSLGVQQLIEPGALNWMSAGRGIVHSERSGDEARRLATPLHGVQAWVALPEEREEEAPRFEHHAAAAIPARELEDARVRLLAGEGFGLRSPLTPASPLAYAELRLAAGASLEIDEEHDERALYLVAGDARIADERIAPRTMVVLERGRRVRLRAERELLAMFLAGAPLGPRFIEWNFVSSSRERIERAKADWRARRFPLVPGDERERVPLPGEGSQG